MTPPITKYDNVKNPLLLHDRVEAAETVTLAQNTAPYLCLTRAGVYPASAGAYVAGVTQLERLSGESTAIATDGVTIAKVKAAATILVDSPLAGDVDGTVYVAGPTDYVLGHAIDTSTGSTGPAPQYIRVALRR